MNSTRIVSSRDVSEDDVEVHPRYLAGASSSPDDAFASLSSRRWHHFTDERGNRYANNISSRFTVAFLPETSDMLVDATAMWQIRARAEPEQKWLWTVALTEGAPPEFIGAVTKAIDRDLADGEQGQNRVLAGGGDDHPDLIWDTLREADFHSAVPAHLIVAFTAALTDPAPLTRDSRDLPESSRVFATPRVNPRKAQ